MSIRLGPQACGTLDEAALREWLVADGVGGYAMGTVAGLRTRRYHGLLAVARRRPRRARMLGLAALDPVLVARRRAHPARRRTSGAAASSTRAATSCSSSFDLDDGVPRWRWQVGGIVLERELAMAHGGPAVGVVHRLVAADRPVRLELTPLCTWRSVHGERHEYGAPGVEQTADGFVFEGAYRVAGAGWHGGGEWYRDVRAREEAARGLSDREDLWAAGHVRASTSQPGGAHEVTAAAQPFGERLPARRRDRRRARGRAPRTLLRRAGADGRDRRAARARGRPVRDHDRRAARPPSPAIRGSASGRATS